MRRRSRSLSSDAAALRAPDAPLRDGDRWRTDGRLSVVTPTGVAMAGGMSRTAGFRPLPADRESLLKLHRPGTDSDYGSQQRPGSENQEVLEEVRIRRFSNMINAMRRGLKSNGGFTLIELMVVVMIISVLIAIAIPSFLGFRGSAQDRSAQSEVRSVLLAEKGHWLDNAAYTATLTDITAFEPNANVHASDETEGVVPLLATGNQIVCLTRTSDSGAHFGVWESATGGTFYGEYATAAPTSCGTMPTGWVQGGW